MQPSANVQLFLLFTYGFLLGWIHALKSKPSISVERDPENMGRYRINCSLPEDYRFRVKWFRLLLNGHLNHDQPAREQQRTGTFSVDAEGWYSCAYIGSDDDVSPESDSVTVRDLRQPTIFVEKDSGKLRGYRVHCSESTIYDEKLFTLYQGQDLNNISARKAEYGVQSVIFVLPRDAGSTEGEYRCSYHIVGEQQESPYSNPQFIGESYKPSISVERDPEKMGRYRINCSVPEAYRYSVKWFRLILNGYINQDQPAREQQHTRTFSVYVEGRYSCLYTGSYDDDSPESDSVTVRDLPQPTISVENDSGQTGGYQVHCSEPTIHKKKLFTLYRGQDRKKVTAQKTETGAQATTFILPRDAGSTAGEYRCSYHIMGEQLESPYSDPQLINEDAGSDDNPLRLALFIAIPCVILLLVFLSVTLLYYFISRRKKAIDKDPTRLVPSEEDGATTTPFAAVNTQNASVEKKRESLAVLERERQKDEGDTSNEDVTYATLNPEVLKKMNTAPVTPMPEPSIYAALNVH